MNFKAVINLIRSESLTEKEKGDRFERLIKNWFKADPTLASAVEQVWLWREFPAKSELGSIDLGIDLVVRADSGDYWAVQCKFHGADAKVDKNAIDSFISNSSRAFTDPVTGIKTTISARYWVSTNETWGPNALEAISNTATPFQRITMERLEQSEVDWEALLSDKPQQIARKCPMPHQEEALAKALAHYQDNERGKLTMACGTGKTYTSLLIAENLLKNESGKIKGSVLFLVPSISLLNQSLNAWMADKTAPMKAVCICSDSTASRKRSGNDENSEGLCDLALPASTSSNIIAGNYLQEARALKDEGLLVVFSTYQSIERVAEAQTQISTKLDIAHSFDLIICDEAHRTTGIMAKESRQPEFTRIHNADFIRGKKRLYMTATPRIYGPAVKSKAKEEDFELCSMDDIAIYGEEFHRVSFGYAVANGLLTDYKVLILTVGSEWQLTPELRDSVEQGESKELSFDHISRLVGCINGLAKNTVHADNGLVWESDPRVMRRAIAFCANIDKKGDPASSMNTRAQLAFVSDKLASGAAVDPLTPAEMREATHPIRVSAEHIDGSMDTVERSKKLRWLAEETGNPEECRVLCNVRCLSEGIDVPALDAAIFLSPRKSQVDVVQSVGRVMRNFRKGETDAKKFGYIIIPVAANPNVSAHDVMDKNAEFKTVWQVLTALRAHDERFNAEVNSIAFRREDPNKKPRQPASNRICVLNSPFYHPELGQLSLEAQQKLDLETRSEEIRKKLNDDAQFLNDLDNKIYAKMVEKVGSRFYWERWARDIAPVARNIIARIKEIVATPGEARAGFLEFLQALRLCINDSVTEAQAIEMLGQHLITRPVFEALFADYAFERANGVTAAMQDMVAILDRRGLQKDTAILAKFYDSVRLNLGNVNTLFGKQTVIKNLYDSFFKGAFPKAVEQLGIVYTPVECVDFIIHSVDAVLRREFGIGLTDEGVHVLDPFAGTGTLITRLLQSGLIRPEDLERKYKKEIHCNELVLLAYYVADVNIESVYYETSHAPKYLPFDGICFTDTFELAEREPEPRLLPVMQSNAEDIERQSKLPIRVIIGNPPYSAGQKSGNDNAQNLDYPQLDKRIAETYAANVEATNKNSLYDSYIRAFRWASDRIRDNEEGGVIGFVTNSKWLDGKASSGLRRCLEREFSSIYVFDLRGAIRGKASETARREGGNVFNILTGVCMVILFYNPKCQGKAQIHYCDIGDYLSQREKLDIIKRRGSIFSPDMDWKEITPDEHGDWLRQRSGLFAQFILIGDKKDKQKREVFFMPEYSTGIQTNRDAWVYNYSRASVEKNVTNAIQYYNNQCDSVQQGHELSLDPRYFKWTDLTREKAQKNKKFTFNHGRIETAIYRPFTKRWLYFSPELNHRPGNMPQLFPSADVENLVICLNDAGGRKDFSCLITDKITDLEIIEKSQCFPLYYYREKPNQQGVLLGCGPDYQRHNGISDWIFANIRSRFGAAAGISRKDIFFYVYGILHSPDYRARFNDDLKKSLPRIPICEKLSDFMAFANAGERLASLHLNYEAIPPCPAVNLRGASLGDYKVEKMRFGGKPGAPDKSRIIYNSQITLTDIPLRAYDYVVNGRSAIEWIMESYRVKTDKDSGIVNDPNLWAKEHDKQKYILDLLMSVIEVSLRTLKIVDCLPRLKWEENA